MRFTVRIPEEVEKSRKPFQQLPGGAGNVVQDTVYLQPPVLLDICCSFSKALPVWCLGSTLPPLSSARAAKSSRCFSSSTPLFPFCHGPPPAPTPAMGMGLSDCARGSCSVHPTFWFSSPPTPHLGFKFKGTLKEALCDWAVIIQGTVTTWAELLHQPILLATRHSMYGCLWVRPQFSVPFAVAGEAGLRVTCVTAGL